MPKTIRGVGTLELVGTSRTCSVHRPRLDSISAVSGSSFKWRLEHAGLVPLPFECEEFRLLL
eukprot:scaffold566_cov364-Pavlova_lutheri.AAC.33